jgi:hypothetical protein
LIPLSHWPVANKSVVRRLITTVSATMTVACRQKSVSCPKYQLTFMLYTLHYDPVAPPTLLPPQQPILPTSIIPPPSHDSIPTPQTEIKPSTAPPGPPAQAKRHTHVARLVDERLSQILVKEASSPYSVTLCARSPPLPSFLPSPMTQQCTCILHRQCLEPCKSTDLVSNRLVSAMPRD